MRYLWTCLGEERACMMIFEKKVDPWTSLKATLDFFFYAVSRKMNNLVRNKRENEQSSQKQEATFPVFSFHLKTSLLDIWGETEVRIIIIIIWWISKFIKAQNQKTQVSQNYVLCNELKQTTQRPTNNLTKDNKNNQTLHNRELLTSAPQQEGSINIYVLLYMDIYWMNSFVEQPL